MNDFTPTDRCPECGWEGVWDSVICPECSHYTLPLVGLEVAYVEAQSEVMRLRREVARLEEELRFVGVSPFLRETQKEIDSVIDEVEAVLVEDLMSRKDPLYVNPDGPMVGYIECEKHGEVIGYHWEYPGGRAEKPAECYECLDEFIENWKKERTK